MPIGTPLQLVERIDTKFGAVDAELANKLDPPSAGGTFDPTLIDLSLGQVDYENFAQTEATAFALDGTKTPVVGGSVAVNITGGGFAVTFSSPFVGLEGLVSGTILETDVDYPFLFRFAEDWDEVAPGVFEDRVLVGAVGIKIATARIADGALGPVPDDAGFDPTAIDLSGNSAPDYTQSGAVELALDGGVTAIDGATCWIAWTGDNANITCDGSTVKWSDGTAGAKTLDGLGTLVVSLHPALGYAVAFLEGGGMSAAEILAALLTVDGTGSGLDADLLDGQHASALLDRANHTGVQAKSTVTGLQTDLDGKAPLASPTFTGVPVLPSLRYSAADIDLAGGAQTLSPAVYVQNVFGTAGSSFTLTLSNGSVHGQVVELRVLGATIGANVIPLKDAAGTPNTIINAIENARIYRLRWNNGSGLWERFGTFFVSDITVGAAIATPFLLLELPEDKSYAMIGYAAATATIASLKHRSSSGTATVEIAINGTPVTGLSAVAISSTPGSATATAANVIAPGDRVTATLSATTPGLPVDVELTLLFA